MGSPLRAGGFARRIQSCRLQPDHLSIPRPAWFTPRHNSSPGEHPEKKEGAKKGNGSPVPAAGPRTELFPCLNGRAPECFLDGLRSPKGRGLGPGPGAGGVTPRSCPTVLGTSEDRSSGCKQTLSPVHVQRIPRGVRHPLPQPLLPCLPSLPSSSSPTSSPIFGILLGLLRT